MARYEPEHLPEALLATIKFELLITQSSDSEGKRPTSQDSESRYPGDRVCAMGIRFWVFCFSAVEVM